MRVPTPKERVLEAFDFRETDIVPYDVVIEPEVEERLNKYYGGTAWENMLQKHFINVAFPSELEFVDENCFRDEYGCLWDTRALPIHLVEPR